jgi:protease IV
VRFVVVGVANAFRLFAWFLRGVLRMAVHRKVPGWVAFEISGDPPDRVLSTGWRRFARRPGALRIASIQAFGEQLDSLAREPRISGIVVKIEALRASLAHIGALREHLARFRQSGKRVIAYVRAVDSREYMLAAAADSIYVAPAGRIDLTGFAADATVVGAALKRLGVHAEFVRRGEYKTAPEMFTHEAVSPAQRKTLEGLLDELYGALVQAVAQRRGRDEVSAKAAIDAGPYTAARAVEAKLADGIADGEDLERMTTPQGEKPNRLATYAGFLAAQPFRKPTLARMRRRSRLAVVPVRGVIKTGESASIPVMGSSFAGSDSVVRALRAARENRAMRGVLLYVDSRGGSALASELVHRAVERCAAEKPVVAYFDRVAASGGYMVAAPATRIVSSPTALVGSIGVFAGKFDASTLLDRLGVSSVTIQRGEHAAMLSPVRPMSEDERHLLDREIDEVYRDFLQIVSKGRKMSTDEVHRRAEGRVFSGRAAMEQGLVDELGNFESAVGRLSGLAKVEGEPALSILDFGQRSWNPIQSLRPLAGEIVWAMLPFGIPVP